MLAEIPEKKWISNENSRVFREVQLNVTPELEVIYMLFDK